MVGVGGRSKACNHCRRRRIKCDFVQPICGKCSKWGLKCDGGNALTIIEYKGNEPESKVPLLETSSEGGIDLVSHEKRLGTSSEQAHMILLGSTLSIPHDDIFVNYTRAHVLRGPDSEDIVTIGIDRSLTDMTFLALATTFFGAKHREAAIIQKGLGRYSGAIKVVNSAIGNPDRRQSFDLLEAIVVLSIFEFLVAERDQGWASHARGLERLMQLRGPERFTSLHELMILERARPSIIFAALVLRKTTIMAQPEWKSIPWRSYPNRKTLMQISVDILADCPGLVAEKAKLDSEATPAEPHLKYQNLALRARHLVKDLENLLQAWSSISAACSWEVPSPSSTPIALNAKGEPVPLWATIFRFQSYYDADLFVLTHAIRIFVLRFVQALPSSSTQDEEEIPNALTLSGMAVCRSVDFHLGEMRKGAVGHIFFYSLKMAFEAVGKDVPAIGAWLKNIHDHISSGLSERWSLAALIKGQDPSNGTAL